eukprot:15460274-Alexandrium_andersonii.AAC.1
MRLRGNAREAREVRECRAKGADARLRGGARPASGARIRHEQKGDAFGGQRLIERARVSELKHRGALGSRQCPGIQNECRKPP